MKSQVTFTMMILAVQCLGFREPRNESVDETRRAFECLTTICNSGLFTPQRVAAAHNKNLAKNVMAAFLRLSNLPGSVICQGAELYRALNPKMVLEENRALDFAVRLRFRSTGTNRPYSPNSPSSEPWVIINRRVQLTEDALEPWALESMDNTDFRSLWIDCESAGVRPLIGLLPGTPCIMHSTSRLLKVPPISRPLIIKKAQ
jgi:hypothetical protein